MKDKTVKMTEGSPAGLIIRFAFPLMIGNMLQQVYIMTDTLIVSRVLGMNALAALGASDWLSYMMISTVQAASQGFAILLAQDFGAGRREHLHDALAHAILLAVILTAVLTAGALVLMNPMLALLHTPKKLMGMTSSYLGIIYAGLPAVMLMNFGSSVLRAFGDSRTPLVAVALSAGLNVALDLAFVAGLGTGVAGAAAATVIAQLAAGLFCLAAIGRIEWIHLKRSNFARKKGLGRKLLGLSWPMMLQNLVISLGGLAVQSQVNRCEITFISGYTATNKIYGLLEMAAIAYGYAMVTYIGQNYGAGLTSRVKKGVRQAVIAAVATSVVIGGLMIVFGRDITGMFLTGEGAEVGMAMDTSYLFLVIMAVPLPVLYILYIARSSLQGLGNTVVPMVSGAAECATRIFFAYAVVLFAGSKALLMAEPAAWFAAMVILTGSLLKKIREMEKKSAAS